MHSSLLSVELFSLVRVPSKVLTRKLSHLLCNLNQAVFRKEVKIHFHFFQFLDISVANLQVVHLVSRNAFWFPYFNIRLCIVFFDNPVFISYVFVVDVNKIIHPLLPIYCLFSKSQLGWQEDRTVAKFFVGGFRGRKERSFNKMGVGG